MSAALEARPKKHSKLSLPLYTLNANPSCEELRRTAQRESELVGCFLCDRMHRPRGHGKRPRTLRRQLADGTESRVEMEVPRLLCVTAKALGLPYTVTILPRGLLPHRVKVTSSDIFAEIRLYATGKRDNLALSAEALGYEETKSFGMVVRMIREQLAAAHDLLAERITGLGRRIPACVFRPRSQPKRVRLPLYRDLAAVVRLGGVFLEVRNEIPELETVPRKDLVIFLYTFLWPRLFRRPPPPSPVSE